MCVVFFCVESKRMVGLIFTRIDQNSDKYNAGVLKGLYVNMIKFVNDLWQVSSYLLVLRWVHHKLTTTI